MYLEMRKSKGRVRVATRSERNRAARLQRSRKVLVLVIVSAVGTAAGHLLGGTLLMDVWHDTAREVYSPVARYIEPWTRYLWWLIALVPLALLAVGALILFRRRRRASYQRPAPTSSPRAESAALQSTPLPLPTAATLTPSPQTEPTVPQGISLPLPTAAALTTSPQSEPVPPHSIPLPLSSTAALTPSPQSDPAAPRSISVALTSVVKPTPPVKPSLRRGLFARSVLGIDVGNSQTKIVEVVNGKPPRLLKQAIVPTPRGSVENGIVKDPAALSAAIFAAISQGGFSTRRAATTLTGQNLMLRKLTLPPMPKRELRAAIDWQVEQVLQLNRDDTLTDFSVMPTRQGEPSTVILVAMQREPIINFVDFMQSAGFEIVRVDIEPLAVFRAALLATESRVGTGTHLLCDFGGGTTNLSIFREGVLQTARVVMLGGNQFTRALMVDHHLDFDEAEAIKIAHGFKPDSTYIGALLPVRDRLFGEIATTVNFFLAENKGVVIDSMQIVGGNSLLPSLAEQLEQNLRGVMRSDDGGFRVALTNPLTHMAHDMPPEELNWGGASLSVAVGLALGEV